MFVSFAQVLICFVFFLLCFCLCECCLSVSTAAGRWLWSFFKAGGRKKTIFWWLESKMLLRNRVYSRSSWWPPVCQGRRSGLFNFFTLISWGCIMLDSWYSLITERTFVWQLTNRWEVPMLFSTAFKGTLFSWLGLLEFRASVTCKEARERLDLSTWHHGRGHGQKGLCPLHSPTSPFMPKFVFY